jgi:UPF0755 protein
MAAVYIITGMNDLLAVNRTDSSTVKIEIPENPTVDDVTKVLVDNKVIGEPSYFKLFVNVTKSADDFTQGTYEIRRNMDYEAIINFLSSNNNRTDTVSVTITEGESVLEIANTLEKNGALGDRDEFLSLCNMGASRVVLAREIPLHKKSLLIQIHRGIQYSFKFV